MTPQEVIDAARARYNASSDTFWSDAELFQHLWEACHELAHEAFVIEKYATTTSTATDNSYAFPTRCIAFKRVTYNGKRLEPIQFREDDQLTFFDTATTQSGEPDYYYQWADSIYLRPTPDTSALTIEYFYYAEPEVITAASTLEIPTMWQPKCVDYIVGTMAIKEKNYTVSDRYLAAWQQTVQRAKAWRRKSKRGDSFAVVQDETSYIEISGVR